MQDVTVRGLTPFPTRYNKQKNVNTMIIYSHILVFSFLLFSADLYSAESDAAKKRILDVATQNEYLWRSGTCRWSEKKYVGLPIELLDGINKDMYKLQVPDQEESTISQSFSDHDYEKLIEYLNRYVPVNYCCEKIMYFNEEGWRLDTYTYMSIWGADRKDIVYRYKKLPNLARHTSLQFGDKKWERGEKSSNFEISQGAPVDAIKKVPLPLGGLMSEFFVHNLFSLQVPGRTVEASETGENVYEIKCSVNEGVTIFEARVDRGILKFSHDETKIKGKRVNLHGEAGSIMVTGDFDTPPDGRPTLPRFFIQIEHLRKGNIVNVTIRELEEYSCKKIPSEKLMEALNE
jgi:hypothetical protein